MDSSYVGAYWGARKESAAEGAERLAACLNSFAHVDTLLGSWRHLGRSKATARTPVVPDPQALEQLLMEGRNRRDDDRSVIEELGFRIGMWNGQKPAVGLSAGIGLHAASHALTNSFVLNLPGVVGDGASLYVSDVARRIIEAIVESWDPDWATWCTDSLREAQDAPARTPVVGWMTYLSDSRLTSQWAATLGAVPLHEGWLVPAGDNALSVNEETVVKLRRTLEAAGALTPMP